MLSSAVSEGFSGCAMEDELTTPVVLPMRHSGASVLSIGRVQSQPHGQLLGN